MEPYTLVFTSFRYQTRNVIGRNSKWPPAGVGKFSLACALAAMASAASSQSPLHADTTYQEIGLTNLQLVAPQLNGAGVSVGQVEATPSSGSSNLSFEANSNLAPSASFTYVDANGASSSSYNATLGSWHANYVGSVLYGAHGVAPGVSNVAMYAESYFAQAFPVQQSPSVGSSVPSVINQSFMYPNASPDLVQTLNTEWDNLAAYTNVLYVTSIGDGETTGTSPSSYINPPATMYDGIAVGVYSGTVTGNTYSASSSSSASTSWVGPTSDGRSKPDLVAPVPTFTSLGNYTSYSAPVVSGVAVLMEQAARGTNLPGPVGFNSSAPAISSQGATAYTAAATDIRTVKALMLNGAVKPVDWTNSYSGNNGSYTYNAPTTHVVTPLDPRYGSGVVNAYNSYENLAGGEHTYSSATSQSIAALPTITSSPTAGFSGSAAEAASATNPATIEGWNLATITTTANNNAVENYDFNLTGASSHSWDLTATLSWNKDYNTTGINHLMLFLLNSAGQNIAGSTSMVDNVQQININPALGINSLMPGQYDLAVEMLGGSNAISTSDTYALAWNFVDPTSVPEPAALAIFAIGLGMFMLPRKRKVVVAQR